MAGRADVRRGKLEQLEHQYRLATAARQPHRRLADVDPLDVRLECPVGRLSASGKITDEEYRAAQRYRNMAFRWLHAIGAPYPFAQACDAEFTIAGLMKMPRDSDCARIEHEYKQANSAILGPDGNRRGVATAVRNVVVYEAEPRSEFEFELLRVGLASLVSHFGKVVKVVSFRPDITTAA